MNVTVQTIPVTWASHFYLDLQAIQSNSNEKGSHMEGIKQLQTSSESFFGNQDRITKYKRLNTNKTKNRGKEGIQRDNVFLNFQFQANRKVLTR